MLLHEGDTALAGRPGVEPGGVLAPQLDRALVGRVEAGEDAHQRRLAGAVLAEQGVDLARPQHEVDVVRAPRRTEGLATPGHADGRPPASPVRVALCGPVVIATSDQLLSSYGTSNLPSWIAASWSSYFAIASAEILASHSGLMTTSMPPSFSSTS